MIKKKRTKNQKEIKSLDTQLRVPRPFGATQLGFNYHQGLNNPNKDKAQDTLNHQKQEKDSPIKPKKPNPLINYYTKLYVHNNYEICSQWMGIMDLAKYLGISEVELQGKIMIVVKAESKALNKADLGSLTRDSIFKAFLGHQEAKSLARNQALNLYHLQAGKYVPFLSGEATKAIKTFSDVAKADLDFLKALMPAAPTIQVTNQQNMATVNNQIIGPDEASKLIEDKIAHIPFLGTQHIAYLEQKNNPIGLPEIVATKAQEEAIMAQKMREEGRILDGDLGIQDRRDMRDNDALNSLIEDEE